MKYETKYQTLKLSELVTPPYNPREDILRGSDEYNALRRSIEQHGMVEPPVVNLVNMRCIGGNQRLTVLRDMGVTEVLCSVIEQPDEAQEKKLCLALNRIEGRWQEDRLGDLLRDDAVMEYETGFDADEVALYKRLEDAREPDVGGDDDFDPDAEGEEADGEDLQDDADGADQEADTAVSTTLVRIGHLHFKVEVPRYKRLVESIRDQGIFEEREIAEEMKRRLMQND
jgi:ParB-like chromosome segregation protein Spo0J